MLVDVEVLFEEMADVGFDVELVEGYSGKEMGDNSCSAILLRDKFDHGHLLSQFPEIKHLRMDGFGDGLVFF